MKRQPLFEREFLGNYKPFIDVAISKLSIKSLSSAASVKSA